MNKILLLVTALVLIGLISYGFYWKQVRPAKVVRSCNIEAQEKSQESSCIFCTDSDERVKKSYNDEFQICMRSHGIK